jgi:hypothetical protein
MRKWKRGGGSTTPSAYTPSPSPSPSIQPSADSHGHGLASASGYNPASEAQSRHGLASESGGSPGDAHDESNRGQLPPPSPSPSTNKSAAPYEAPASPRNSAYLPPGGRGRRAGGAWTSSSPGAGRGRGMAPGGEFGGSERADSVASNMTEASDWGRGTPAMSEAGRGAEESKGGKGWEKIPRQSVFPSSYPPRSLSLLVSCVYLTRLFCQHPPECMPSRLEALHVNIKGPRLLVPPRVQQDFLGSSARIATSRKGPLRHGQGAARGSALPHKITHTDPVVCGIPIT